MVERLDPEFQKAIQGLCGKYWKHEISEALKVFAMKKPDTSEYKYENKKLEADLNFIAKHDAVKSNKLKLIRQMALLMTNDISGSIDSEAQEGILQLLGLAQKRIANGQTKEK